MPRRVVVIDNYDSFVYNLVQYLGELGAEPVVVRNDEAEWADLRGEGVGFFDGGEAGDGARNAGHRGAVGGLAREGFRSQGTHR